MHAFAWMFLRKRLKINDAIIKNMMSWHHSGIQLVNPATANYSIHLDELTAVFLHILRCSRA